MHKVLALSKAMLKNSSNVFYSPKKSAKRQNKKINRTFAIIGLSLLYLYIAGIVGFTIFSASSTLASVGEGELLSPFLGLMTVAIGLFFGLFMMFSTFFTASDNHLWLPLPFKTADIFTARFLTTIVFIMIMQIMFIVPAFIGYNIAVTPGILSYLGQLLLLIFLPVLLVSISFILVLMLSRIVNIQKYRTIFQAVSGALIFIFTFGVSFLSSSGGQIIGEGGDDMAVLVDMVRQASEGLGWARFITFFTDGAFINQGYLSLLLPLSLVALAVLLFLLAYSLSNRYYHASLFSVDISKKKNRVGHTKTIIKTTSPILAFFRNEVKLIFRSPTYLFNLLIPPIIVPLIIVGSFAASFSASEEIDFNLMEAINFLFQPENSYMLVAVIAVAGFISMMNLISATSFTREGNNAQLIKIYPVSPREILYGKMLLGLVVNFLIIIPVIIVLGIIARAHILVVLSYIIGATLISLLMNYASVLLDARFPMLNWTNEIEAAKNNKNVLISVGVNFVIVNSAVLLLIPTLIFQLPMWATFLIVFLFYGILIAVFELVISKSGSRLFKKIQ